MNEVRQKLLNSMIEPAADSRSTSTFAGTIISVNEKTNICTVSYTRQDGKKINKDNVPVMLSNKSIIDWFPEEGENVLLQEKNNVTYITGPSCSNYESIRNSISLVNDVFSDSFVDVLGGFLF